MTLFRHQRELLEDSMKTCREVGSKAELAEILNVNSDQVNIKYYSRDSRIGWDTYIVTVDGNAVGFTDGILE